MFAVNYVKIIKWTVKMIICLKPSILYTLFKTLENSYLKHLHMWRITYNSQHNLYKLVTLALVLFDMVHKTKPTITYLLLEAINLKSDN